MKVLPPQKHYMEHKDSHRFRLEISKNQERKVFSGEDFLPHQLCLAMLIVMHLGEIPSS